MSPYPWQIQQWEFLCNSEATGRLHQSILLAAVKNGLGLSDFAKAWITRQFCVNRQGDSGLCCGKCQQCQMVFSGNHPDVLWIESEDKKIIKTSNISYIKDFFNVKSSFSSTRWIVIDGVELLHRNMANALLKVLEEPLPAVHFLLITRAPNNLILSMKSRCQIIDFSCNKISCIDWLAHEEALEKKSGVASSLTTEKKFAVLLTDNAPFAALALLKEDRLKILLDWLKIIFSGKALNAPEKLAEISKDTSCLLLVFQSLLRFLHLVMVYRRRNKENLLACHSNSFQDIFAHVSTRDLLSFYKAVLKNVILLKNSPHYDAKPLLEEVASLGRLFSRATR